MTGHRGVFAGADMIPADRTVTVAIGQLELARPITTFDEVTGGLDETAAMYEAVGAYPVATASNATTASASAQTTR